MNKKTVLILLVGIIILSAVLRLWQLSVVPPSPDWDEASLGYNAYSILHTGKDEYGKFLPVLLRSFDDYKPALYAYTVIPSIAIFGLTLFAVRLPSAIFGIITVFLVFILVKELFKKDSLALLSSFLLAISPWHIQFSRVAFETNLGLFLNILGALLFIKAFKKPYFLIFSAFVFALNLYAYQSEKVFTPLFVIALCIIFFKPLLKLPKKTLATSIIVGIIVSLPIVLYIATDKSALSRAAGVSIFNEQSDASRKNALRLLQDKNTNNILGEILDNRRVYFAKKIAGNYLSHWNLDWLFITGDIGRHHAPGMGIIYLWDLPFILIGISGLLFGKEDKKTKWLIFSWFLLAPVPASITTGVPHAVRTLNFLPTFQIFSAIGIINVFKFLKQKKKIIFYTSFGLILAFVIFNFIYYLNQYFVQYNYFSSQDWQYGYKQAVLIAQKNENKYQNIIVSNAGDMDQSYIFFLFYLKYPPALFQKEEQENLSQGNFINRKFGKYEFRPINWQVDQNLHNTLFIGNPDEIPDANSSQLIRNLDGSATIKIVEN